VVYLRKCRVATDIFVKERTRQKKIVMWMERYIIFLLVLVITGPILSSVYQGRHKLVGAEEKTIEEISAYTAMLGSNEYDDMNRYVQYCK